MQTVITNNEPANISKKQLKKLLPPGDRYERRFFGFAITRTKAEQLYFYLLCDNDEDRTKFLDCRDAWEAKKLSKMTTQKDWKFNHIPVMREVLELKFTQNVELRKSLESTDGKELLHYAPWGDTYWGVDKDLKGRNTQGKMLMELRDKFLGKTQTEEGFKTEGGEIPF